LFSFKQDVSKNGYIYSSSDMKLGLGKKHGDEHCPNNHIYC